MADRSGAGLSLAIAEMTAKACHIRSGILLATFVMMLGGVALASEVQTDGKVSVTQTAPLFAVCTDPVVQETLEQDFRGAHRGPDSGHGLPVTVTVTVNEKLLKPGVVLDESLGDLLFSSTAPLFRTESLLSRNVTSRTYSFYYPRTRPGTDRSLIVSSTNANYGDWAGLSLGEYEASKRDLVETTIVALSKYIPNIREILDHAEASTPLTFQHYTKHVQGASFGTKFEGLAVSRAIPQQIAGLFHAGSVGIIMSGWLGAMNYGVIVANDVDSLLIKSATPTPVAVAP